MSFALPAQDEHDPHPIMRRLIDTAHQFETLRIAEADIMIVMRLEPKLKAGRHILGTMALPGFQGANNQFGLWLLEQFHGSMPHFVMTLDNEWWRLANALEREALIFHELMHCEQARDKEGELRFDDMGLPVWAIRGHDLEEFNDVVERYGLWKSDIRDFLAAAERGRNV